MNPIKYMHSKNTCEHFTNDKVQSTYIKCIESKINNQFPLNIILNQIRWKIMLK
jgi:hypothetical protein